MTVSIDPAGFAAALEVPVTLIAYVLDEYEGDEPIPHEATVQGGSCLRD